MVLPCKTVWVARTGYRAWSVYRVLPCKTVWVARTGYRAWSVYRVLPCKTVWVAGIGYRAWSVYRVLPCKTVPAERLAISVNTSPSARRRCGGACVGSILPLLITFRLNSSIFLFLWVYRSCVWREREGTLGAGSKGGVGGGGEETCLHVNFCVGGFAAIELPCLKLELSKDGRKDRGCDRRRWLCSD